MHFMMCSLPQDIQREEGLGNFRKALKLIERWLKDERISPIQKERLLYEKERINRLLETYPFSEKQAIVKAKEIIQDFSTEEFHSLLEEGYIDYIVVEGEKKFEERFIPNIGFALNEYRERIKKDPDSEKARSSLNDRLVELTSGAKPKKYRVHARIEAKIEDGAGFFRVWLPFPKEEFQISDVKFLRASQKDCFISPNSSEQRIVYFEGKEKEYFVEFEYTVREWVHNSGYNIDSNLDQYLCEEPPHIVFTPYIRKLTDTVTGEEKDPYLRARKIYDWITKHVRYSYVRPYATYENIAQYVAENLKGDCGFQAILFITMCRIAGIAARWQSGWYANPYFASPHDWALFYVQPYGWLPADLSFGGARRDNEQFRQFYFGNLDGFRMVANSGFARDFVPKTNFYRDDPTDNQVGEAEAEDRKVRLKSKIQIVKFEEIQEG
ncbi:MULTISPECIES: transglutaminase-like domain-containing protein [Pseudothermotoga]|uniref:transglutaminase-like domain-containing protein n=1 Tax=Pseudothermotoga TaxID=1643951 RepID=UPI0004296AB8|nr:MULTISPECIES: transglutaminase-like domain-containing protein [Pseudothermotoga]KUK21979.1 MAG: Transglutaminase domain protein [Pseudothermotoga lettingae]MDI3494244.1 hypothetical protein [Pseudothermotoga sp.]HBT25577.1 transglutaminase [Pseudothermotoga sp.]